MVRTGTVTEGYREKMGTGSPVQAQTPEETRRDPKTLLDFPAGRPSHHHGLLVTGLLVTGPLVNEVRVAARIDASSRRTRRQQT